MGVLVNKDSAHVITGCKGVLHTVPASEMKTQGANPSGAITLLALPPISCALQTCLLGLFSPACVCCYPLAPQTPQMSNRAPEAHTSPFLSLWTIEVSICALT